VAKLYEQTTTAKKTLH